MLFLSGEFETNFHGWRISLELYRATHSVLIYRLSMDSYQELHLVCFGGWPIPAKLSWVIDEFRFYKTNEPSFGSKNRIVLASEEIICNSFFVTTNFSVDGYIQDPEGGWGDVQFASWRNGNDGEEKGVSDD